MKIDLATALTFVRIMTGGDEAAQIFLTMRFLTSLVKNLIARFTERIYLILLPISSTLHLPQTPL